MTTFTIDADNNITAFAAQAEAAALSTTPFDSFASQQELAELVGSWPAERLVEVWNGIPGVKAITRFTNRKAGVSRVWKAIQGLAKPAPETKPAEKPLAKKADGKKEPKAKGKAVKTGKAAKSAKV